MHKATIQTYLQMLTYKRPHGSFTEQEFLFDFIDPISGISEDEFGNRILKIGENPRTCFSAHVDTVHHSHGKQKIVVDEESMLVYKDDNECLGADDASGCIVLMKLIEEQVPGLYIFHRGEERGGLGSRWIAKNTPKLFDDIDHCVAFDRRATSSIITFQRSQRCCSQEFVDALAKQFLQGPYEMEFEADDGGSFTDSASYTTLVSECTNVSIGYYDEHTPMETQDLEHLKKMLETIHTIDWNSLPAERDTTKVEKKQWKGYSGGNYRNNWDDWDNYGKKPQQQALPPASKKSSSYQTGGDKPGYMFPVTYTYNPDTKKMEQDPLTWAQCVQFVRQYPQVAADIIEEMEYTPDDIEFYVRFAMREYGGGWGNI